MSAAKRAAPKRRSRGSAFLYLAPLLLGMAVFTIWPILNVVWISFQEGYQFLTGESAGIGVSSYLTALQDPKFLSALRNTAVYVVIALPASLILGMLFALLLNRPIRGRRLFQILYFFPLVTSTTAIGFSWRWIFEARNGILNQLLGQLGVAPIDWLGDPAWGMLVLAVFGTWGLLPLTTILLLVGLQNLDARYTQAARVDGANPWAIFTTITLPLLRPTIGLVLILNLITCTLVFDQLFPLFNGKPGVAGSLYTVVFYIYDTFYNRFDVATASAAAVMFSLVVLAAALIQLRLQRGKGARA